MENSKISILLVEDDFLALQTNRRILSNFGQIKLAQLKNIYSIVVSGESREEILKEAFINGGQGLSFKAL